MRDRVSEAGPYRRACVDVVFAQDAGRGGPVRVVGDHPLAQRLLDAVAGVLRGHLPTETRCSVSEEDRELTICVRYRGGRHRTRIVARPAVLRLEIVEEVFGSVTWESVRLRLTWFREVSLSSGPGHEVSEQRSAAQALAHALGVPLVRVAAE